MLANKKKLILSLTGIGAGLAITAGIYFAIQRKNQKKLTNELLDFENKANKNNEEELTKPEKTELLKKIKIHYEGEFLKIQTIEDIANLILRFCVADFIKLTRRIRKERRELPADQTKIYVELQARYEKELIDIIEKSKAEVLERLGLNAVSFDSANPLNEVENIEKNFTLNAILRQKLLMGIPPTKSLTFAELKEILRAQIEELKKESEGVTALSEITSDRVGLVHLTQNKVYDALFRKYTVEREDIEAYSHVYKGNEIVHGLLVELEKANEELLKVKEIHLSYAEYVITLPTFV